MIFWKVCSDPAELLISFAAARQIARRRVLANLEIALDNKVRRKNPSNVSIEPQEDTVEDL